MEKDRWKRPKVCLTTPEFPPLTWGGLARTAERAARHLHEMGLEVHAAHFIIEDRSDILLDENRVTETHDGIMVHRLRLGRESGHTGGREIWDCPHTLTLRMMSQSLELLHLDRDFDLFHSFFLYPVGYVTGLMAHVARVPHIATLVGNDVKKYIFSPEKAALCRSGLDNADRVVCLSRDLMALAHALTPIESKARVIYNSVDMPAEMWAPRPASGEPFRIGSAGIFKYAKGLPYLFKAVADLHTRMDLVLELRGTVRDSEKENYRLWIDRTGIGDMVRLEPPLCHEDIFEWLRSLDVFVLPSVSEGCPNILMEAMSCGVPCVAARVGAVADLMAEGEAGFPVPYGNSRALAEAVEAVLASPDRGEALGRAARSRMKDFSSRRERSAWEALYRELLEF